MHDVLKEAERLNKAQKVGYVPATVIFVLHAIQNAGLAEHFTIVGAHVLYAYESAAGMRITQSALAIEDVDLLRDARRRVKFMNELSAIPILAMK